MHLLKQGTVPAGSNDAARYAVLLIEPDDVYCPSLILKAVRQSCLQKRGVLRGASSVGGCVRVVLTDMDEARWLLTHTRELPALLQLLLAAR